MTTLADFRTRVLYALGIGTSSSERGFDNASIEQHVKQAVEEFSLYVPLEARADVTVTSGSRSLALGGLVRPITVTAVEYPVEQWPRALLDFDTWGATLTLDHSPPAADYTVRLYFTQQHLVDAAGSTIEPEHEHVIVEGATAIAILARAMGAASAAETSAAAPQTYQHLRVAQTRLNRWRDLIHRLGGGLQRRSFYTAAAAPLSRDIVTRLE